MKRFRAEISSRKVSTISPKGGRPTKRFSFVLGRRVCDTPEFPFRGTSSPIRKDDCTIDWLGTIPTPRIRATTLSFAVW